MKSHLYTILVLASLTVSNQAMALNGELAGDFLAAARAGGEAGMLERLGTKTGEVHDFAGDLVTTYFKADKGIVTQIGKERSAVIEIPGKATFVRTLVDDTRKTEILKVDRPNGSDTYLSRSTKYLGDKQALLAQTEYVRPGAHILLNNSRELWVNNVRVKLPDSVKGNLARFSYDPESKRLSTILVGDDGQARVFSAPLEQNGTFASHGVNYAPISPADIAGLKLFHQVRTLKPATTLNDTNAAKTTGGAGLEIEFPDAAK